MKVVHAKVRHTLTRIALLVALLGVLSPKHSVADTVLPFGAEGWRFAYFAGQMPPEVFTADFDDSGWQEGAFPLGSIGGCEAPGTPWPADELRLVARRKFDVGTYSGIASMRLKLVQGGDVFVNGWPQHGIGVSGTGHCDYELNYAALPVQPGVNTIAIAAYARWLPGVGAFGFLDVQLAVSGSIVRTSHSTWADLKLHYR